MIRILKKVTLSNGCWLWRGFLSADGYGQIKWRGRSDRVHRVMYELARGPIPSGLEIDHLCRVRSCCNPLHLEAVTHRVNTLRGDTIAARNAAKTHCPHGHEYTRENTQVEDGRRRCRTCRKGRHVARQA